MASSSSRSGLDELEKWHLPERWNPVCVDGILTAGP